jgi:hypothetical protein
MAQPHPSTLARRFRPGDREVWLRRVRATTIATAAGAVGATGLLIGLAAHETPSHHSAVTTPTTSGGTGTATTPATGSTTGSTPTGGTSTGGTSAGRTSVTSGPVVSQGSGTAHAATGQS